MSHRRSRPAPGRRSAAPARVRGAAAGMTAQLLNALTNVATAYLASLLLPPVGFGEFAIGFACVTLALATGRGLIGATMLAHLPATRPDERRSLTTSALGFTLLLGLLVSALLVVASVWLPFLFWFAPWLTGALLHDTARYVFLADGRPGRTLVLDAVWALVQAATVTVLWTTGTSPGIGGLATAWGLGALAGLVAFAAMAPDLVRVGGPRFWVATTRDVAGWFSLVSVVGQVEVYAVLVLTGAVLGAADAGGLRAVQLLVYQPPAVLVGALFGLAVPPVARLGPDAPGLPAVWCRTAALVLPIALGALGVALVAEPAMAVLFGQYTAYSPLVLPIAVQAAAAALTFPTVALLLGTRRGRLAFGLHATRLLLVVAGVWVGAVVAGPGGLAWGLAASGLAFLLMTVGVASRLLPRPARAGRRDVEPSGRSVS